MTATVCRVGLLADNGWHYDRLVDENGVAEFRVGVFSGPTVADFSTFTDVTSNRSGGFCSLALRCRNNVDMNQYRLVLDFEPDLHRFYR